jgi:deoxyribonuclease-4
MANKTAPPRTGADALPLIGGQLSSAGGWSQVAPRALAAGAEVVQVFSSNPRVWPTAVPDAEALANFSATLRRHHLLLFIHAVYLVNPASPDELLRERSVAALAHSLVTGALAAAAGVVTHLGSHRGEGFDKAAPWVTEALTAAWAQAERELRESSGAAAASAARASGEAALPALLLETAAGSGATVGATFEELQTLLELLPAPPSSGAVGGAATPGPRPGPTPDAGAPTALSAPRFGLCLDTAHMFAAGYAVHEAPGLAALVEELQRRDLLRRVGLIHLNDSLSLFASRSDRHANPGEGEIGYSGLARVVKHPAFTQAPFVLEVPGSEGHGPGPAEISLVKRMRRGAPSPRVRPGAAERGPVAPS